MNQSLPLIDGGFSGNPLASRPAGPAPPRHTLLKACLMALTCILVLGRTSIAGSLAARDTTPLPDGPDRARAPVRALSDPPVGVARPNTRWTLRPGKHLNAFYVTVGLDDPNDDETSDDPNDDDDGWEGLTAFSETGVPVSALLQEIGCCQSEPGAQSEPLWSAPAFFTSFLTLQPLRC